MMAVMGVRALKIGLLAAAAMLALGAARGGAAEPAPPLVLEQTIPLADVGGRIDHMAVDLYRHRLVVAELGNGTVDVIDLAEGRPVHRIANLPEPQGVAYVSSADRIAVANAGDGSVRLYRAEDAAPVGSVALGEDADNIRVVPGTGRLVVGYGSGGLAVIDAETATQIGNVKLPAHPEAFVLDHGGGRAFVNVPDAGTIAVVDLLAGRQVASWRVPKLRANFPIALDEASGLAAVVFRDPARVTLLNTSTGAVRALSDTCGDADDVFFDLRREHLYISCGEGAVDILAVDDSRALHRLGRVATASGARTALFVPELDRLFVAERAGWLGGTAKLLVYKPAP